MRSDEVTWRETKGARERYRESQERAETRDERADIRETGRHDETRETRDYKTFFRERYKS